MSRRPIPRWSIVLADLDPVVGHEQAGIRRAVVVSYPPFHRSGLVTVCPITAARVDPRFPGDVPIPVGEAGQTKPGVIVCSQIRTVSTARIHDAPMRSLTDPAIRFAVRRAMAHQLGLDIPPVVDGAAA